MFLAKCIPVKMATKDKHIQIKARIYVLFILD